MMESRLIDYLYTNTWTKFVYWTHYSTGEWFDGQSNFKLLANM